MEGRRPAGRRRGRGTTARAPRRTAGGHDRRLGGSAAAFGDGAAGVEDVGRGSHDRARHPAALVRDQDHARRGAAGGELDGVEDPGSGRSGERGAAARPQEHLGRPQQALGRQQVAQRLLESVVAAGQDHGPERTRRRRDPRLDAERVQQVGGIVVRGDGVVHRPVAADDVAVAAALAVTFEVARLLQVAHDVLDGPRCEAQILRQVPKARGRPPGEDHQRPAVAGEQGPVPRHGGHDRKSSSGFGRGS